MNYDDAIEYVINFIKQQTNLDIHEYLANTFALDKIILNEDRHFNNLGIIYNGTGFKPAPIFDNGKSFLVGNQNAINKQTIEEKIKTAYSKNFSPSFIINAKYLEKYCTINITSNCLKTIEQLNNPKILNILTHTIHL